MGGVGAAARGAVRSRHGAWLELICVRVRQSLLTNALSAHILLVAHVALAAVAGWGGDAASIQAEVSEVLADVNGLIQSGGSWKAQRQHQVEDYSSLDCSQEAGSVSPNTMTDQ